MSVALQHDLILAGRREPGGGAPIEIRYPFYTGEIGSSVAAASPAEVERASRMGRARASGSRASSARNIGSERSHFGVGRPHVPEPRRARSRAQRLHHACRADSD